MSRSFRKTPIIKSSGFTYRRWVKRDASGRIRRAKDIQSGKSKHYRRHYPQYDIYDYVCRYTKEEASKDWFESMAEHETYRRFETYHDKMRDWYNTFYWK